MAGCCPRLCRRHYITGRRKDGQCSRLADLLVLSLCPIGRRRNDNGSNPLNPKRLRGHHTAKASVLIAT